MAYIYARHQEKCSSMAKPTMDKLQLLHIHIVILGALLLFTRGKSFVEPSSSRRNETDASCNASERDAFKAGLSDPPNLTSSWKGDDRCKLMGIHCSIRNNHVLKLDVLGRGSHLKDDVPLQVLRGNISSEVGTSTTGSSPTLGTSWRGPGRKVGLLRCCQLGGMTWWRIRGVWVSWYGTHDRRPGRGGSPGMRYRCRRSCRGLNTDNIMFLMPRREQQRRIAGLEPVVEKNEGNASN